MSDHPSFPVRSEDFHRTLVENASEGLLTIDTQSQIVYANPAIEEILGYTPEELIGSSKMTLIPERLRPVHQTALRKYVRTSERNIDWDGIELPALHKEGHEVPTLISLREHEHDGEQYFTGIVRNITDRRRREEKLRQQKEQLDNFAAVVSHDIRSPLTIAQGYTELARERENNREELRQVQQALDRIDELIDDVLTLARDGTEVGEMELLPLTDVIEAAWNDSRTGSATLSIENDLGKILADRSRFRELLTNVFENAVIHVGPEVQVWVGLLADGSGFYLEDDGLGIPESTREQVFEHGYTTREGGTGYGLAIVRRVADAHGWSVRVTSGREGGTRFEFVDVELE